MILDQPLIIILEPSNVGKTTLLYRIYSGIYYSKANIPQRNLEELKVDTTRLRALNIIENQLTPNIYQILMENCSDIILHVDVSLEKTLSEGYDFFNNILINTPGYLDYPVLIFGNKIDKRRISEFEIINLFSIMDRIENLWFVKNISCKSSVGIREGMSWLMDKTGLNFYIPSFRE